MSGPRISVCIPHYRALAEFLLLAVQTAAAAAGSEDEILIAPSDEPAALDVRACGLPARVQVLPPLPHADMVVNWNRCVTSATGALVHLLHDDDAVDAEFYAAIRCLVSERPAAAVYATGYQYLSGAAAPLRRNEPRTTRYMSGDRAADFMLHRGRPYCAGSVVFVADVARRAGLFRPEWPYCPDEHLYLVLAARGGFAFDPRPLYLQRRHPGQYRFRTWGLRDFPRAYWMARTVGAAEFGEHWRRFAAQSSARNLLSVATALGRAGDRLAGIRCAFQAARLAGAARLWCRAGATVAAPWAPALLPLLDAVRRSTVGCPSALEQ